MRTEMTSIETTSISTFLLLSNPVPSRPFRVLPPCAHRSSAPVSRSQTHRPYRSHTDEVSRTSPDLKSALDQKQPHPQRIRPEVCHDFGSSGFRLDTMSTAG